MTERNGVKRGDGELLGDISEMEGMYGVCRD
jgi:hypothetical protein